MPVLELDQPLGASIIRALGLDQSDIPKFILADLDREWDKSGKLFIYVNYSNPPCTGGGSGHHPGRAGQRSLRSSHRATATPPATMSPPTPPTMAAGTPSSKGAKGAVGA